MGRLEAEVGVVLRADALMTENGFRRVTVETAAGPVQRVFLGRIEGRRVAFLYGRFKGPRVPSREIDFVQNQAVWNALGVGVIIGTYVCGGIRPEHGIGTLFLPDDLVGFGGYPANAYPEKGFRSVDMYRPFCEPTRQALLEGAARSGVRVVERATYVCFHGWPRIETKAELAFYKAMGWDLVGQTLDPEATLARQCGCCYAALAVQIDAPASRELFLSGQGHGRQEGRRAIAEGREQMARVIRAAIPVLPSADGKTCRCGHRYGAEVDHFRPLPVDWPED